MFPYYLNYGMDYNLYWYGDPLLVKAYKQAYELGVKRRNEELWLQGLYNFNAFSTAISNIRLDGKYHKPNKYLEKPIDLFPKNEEEKAQDANATRQKLIDNLNAFKRAWDNQKRKEK